MERKLRLGTLTAGKLITDLQEMSQLYTEEDIPEPLWLSTLNEVAAKYKAILAGKDQIEYAESVAIPILKSVSAAGLVGSSFDGDTGLLVLPYSDAVWDNATKFDESWTGIDGTITDMDAATDYKVKIIQFIDENTVLLESTDGTTIPDIAAADLAVSLSSYIKRNEDDVDISQWDKYKRIDQIRKITFTAAGAGSRKTTGEQRLAIGPPKVTEKNFDALRVSHNYADSVMWWREGEVVHFARGSNVKTYGTPGRIMHVVLNPAICETVNDIVDIRYEDTDNLKRAVLMRIISGLPADKVKMRFPNDWVKWYQETFDVKKAKAEEKKEKKDPEPAG